MGFDIFAEITAETPDKIEDIRNGGYGGLIINDIYSRLKLLTGALPYQEKINKKKISEIAKDAHKKIVYELKNYNIWILSELERMERLEIKAPQIDINRYPCFSFYLQFSFKLAKPFLSKDDDQFYICENPIRKDKVFNVPMASASTWKGNMRWSAGKLIELKVTDPYDRLLKRIQLSKLFGHENDAEKRYMNSMMPDKVDDFNEEIKNWTNSNGLRRGRLNSYPTFFDQIGLEVINPHDRKTKAGTLPTYIESAPAGAKGIFSLLYVPFDLMGKPQNQIRDEVMTDLGMVCKVLREMMLTYGFSAKKGSGFGVIEEKIDGTFEMSAPTIYKDNKYSSFNQLEQLVERVIKEVMKNEK